MMTYVILDIVFIALLIVIVMAVFLVRQKEKEIWNNGHCSKCETKWTLFDYDSHGSRGYYCTKCNRYIWISYNIDK